MSPRALAVILSVTLTAPLPARDDCAEALRKATEEFEAGRIEKVENILRKRGCLNRSATTAEAARAWALLAKVYLALAEPERAATAVAELVRLDPEFRPDETKDSGKFVDLVEEMKSAAFTVRVGSVSKTDEPLSEAPATVVVVTAEEIERRGYLDLEQVLHDLPGFDISRGNGDVYSNVYMRGYRSDRSDRMLFIVDGVEQNDLHSNTAYISRQYPLSNVEQIEVVYGPASTIYGANAFTGVISVTTKRPEALLEEGQRIAVHAQIGGGSYGTRYLDATLAGRHLDKRLSWSVTGRTYRSDEPDLAGFADWDFDFPASLDAVDYQEIMRIAGPLAQAVVTAQGGDFLCELLGFCEVVEENGQVVAIELTAEGEAEARRLDRELFELLAEAGQPLGFTDETDDWAIDAKLHVGNLTVGLQTWRRDEGITPWYTELLRTGADNAWTPQQTTLYARYTQPIGRDLVLNLFSRFKQHELDGPSPASRLLTFAGQDLTVVDLALGLGAFPSLQEIAFDQKSTQIRNELTLVYEPSSSFNLVGGIELRNSSVQAELKSSIEEQISAEQAPGALNVAFFKEQLSDTKTDLTDLGIFAQLSFKPRQDLKIVAGGRVDVNSVRGDEVFLTFDRFPLGEIPESFCTLFEFGRFPCDLETTRLELEDTGTVFNPRLALVYTPGDLVFKAIYAEAFKDPSNFQQFTREPGVREFTNSALESERVRNLELHVNWQPHESVAIDLVAYRAKYSNAVSLRQTANPDPLDFPSVGGRFLNIGRLEIRGVQANAAVRVRGFNLFGNYTYTEPVNRDPVDDLGNPISGIDELRIGDIARHRLNFGAHRAFGEKWAVDLRANYVGDRKTGPGTTVDSNPFTEIDSYFVAHATLSYKGFKGILRGTTWQLIVNNLLGTEYFHPGVQRAGVGFAARLPQPERAVFLRLVYKH